jgi:hypothetical protein
MKNIFLCLIIFFTANLSFSQKNMPEKLFDTVSNKLALKKQVLLTNNASFKKHKDEMSGASGFLINYQGQVYAVTAKHVLGEAMGIEPEIKLSEFNNYLISWKMFPRIPINIKTDTVVIGKLKRNYDALDKDILLLEVENSNYNVLPLTPSFNLPKKGEKLYIIGCPYSQEKCKQNLYEITYDSYDTETSMLNFLIKSKVELSGFSGAPIVDSSGNVVSILTSGWDEGKNKFIGGTFIKEIEKVK